MPNETQQPFTDPTQRSTDDRKLVEQVLGTDAADEMAELVDGQTESQETELGSLAAELDLSTEESGNVAEVERSEAEKRREEYVEWAKKIGKDEDWVDDIFVFNTNGTIIADGNLDLPMITTPSQVPPALFEVTGYLNLNNITSAENLTLPALIGTGLNLASLTSAEHLVLPTSIGQGLSLEGLTSAEHLVLPTSIGATLNLRSLTSAEYLILPASVGDRLYLNSLTSTEHLVLPKSIDGDLMLTGLIKGLVPAGCEVKGSVWLRKEQTHIIADARAKGYTVKTE